MLCTHVEIIMPEHAKPLVFECFRGVLIVYIPYTIIKLFISEW